MPSHPLHFFKGRGAGSNPGVRFDAHQRESLAPEEMEWPGDDDADKPNGPHRPKTTVILRQARSIISRNQSPDIGFEQSINPYQGCEHGCVYCYARPAHAYLGLSPGLDFETQIFAKTNAAELLRAELAKPGYQPSLIVLGANTDPYQPAERKLGITRAVLEVLAECRMPVGIITKNALVTRDIDILGPMAQNGLLQVNVSVTTLDHSLARKLDPRASSPTSRIQAIQELAQAGIPSGVFASPMIPAINDVELEKFWRPPPAPVRAMPATCCCGYRWRCVTCLCNGYRRITRCAPSMSCTGCRTRAEAKTTNPNLPRE